MFMKTSTPGILHDIRTIRDIESSLEEAERFIERVKSNKVRLNLSEGNITISRAEMNKITDLVVTLERSGQALETAVQYLRELMAYDEVSQLFARRYLFHLLEKELHRSKRYENSFAIIVFELDPYSQSGLSHIGTEDMNQVVAEAARVVRKYVRDSDSPGRSGERTFMLLLPETDADGAQILCDRISKEMQKDYSVSSGKLPLKVHSSVLESSDPALTDLAGLLYVVDQQLAAARGEAKAA